MATTEAPQHPHERSGRRRPFSTWMKKLTSFKGNSTAADDCRPAGSKRNTYQIKSNSKKHTSSKNNNPYPESGHLNGNSTNGNLQNSFSTNPTGHTVSASSLAHSRRSVRSSQDGHPPPTIGNRSVAPTVSTEPEVAHSDIAASHAPSSGEGTNATIGCGVSTTGRGADSTFSSPAPSVRSLTTTLTTIHSAAAPTTTNNIHNTNNQTVQFSHQFPTSPPPNALPAHLAPASSGGHPATYNTATANGLLTDNASILTLASSSKRRRRRSMDTDASVRALAPSSLWGGSRESLPLSVLSASIDPGAPPQSSHQQSRPSIALNERASIYSVSGIAPALPSERNSYYANKQSNTADGGSVKSGLLGHGRNDSISGSIGGVAPPGSPLASPRDPIGSNAGRLSRTNSAWENGELDREEPEPEHAKEAEKFSVKEA